MELLRTAAAESWIFTEAFIRGWSVLDLALLNNWGCWHGMDVGVELEVLVCLWLGMRSMGARQKPCMLFLILAIEMEARSL